ncbi:MAG: RNA methyltransferase [Candidatus Wallbacteria bacterium]|nr:RNA methyltransferase [Candidatus Wallbacteria bacterium]
MPKFDVAGSTRVLYGIHPVAEALRVAGRVKALYLEQGSQSPTLRKMGDRARAAGIRVETCDRGKLFRLSDSTHHQGAVAEACPLGNGSLRGLLKDHPSESLMVLLLDRVQDPQNLGNIYRTAEASGVALVFLPAKETVSHQLGSVAKASAGAVEHVPTVVVGGLKQPLQELKEAGFRIYGLDQGGASDCWSTEYPGRTALLAGAEGTGLSKPARDLCDELVSVPMLGRVESLNVTNAVAVVLYEILRQRRQTETS